MGRAFVTDIEKLKLSSKTRALEAEKVLFFFSETTKVCSDVSSGEAIPVLFKAIQLSFTMTTHARRALQDGIRPGANLLHAVEVLVSGVCAPILRLQYSCLALCALLMLYSE